MNDTIHVIAEYVLNAGQADRHQLNTLVQQANEHFQDLLYWANKIRMENFGNRIRVCSIVPGRRGGCTQDCAFCAQSSRYNTEYKQPEYLTDEQILSAAKKASENNIPNIGIVYSGQSISEQQLERIEKLAGKITDQYNIGICASFGIINPEQAQRLANAGITRYNHNIETSSRHFPNIVTTHKYQQRTDTIKAAQQAGMGVCAGGIFGIGENLDDRIDMAMQLRSLGVDTVPLNFLHPIPGTPMAKQKPLSPREILVIIALFRFAMPETTLKVAGGRVLNLRDMQSWIFTAGANAILTGDYLTTAGRDLQQDLQMLEDLGLEVERQ